MKAFNFGFCIAIVCICTACNSEKTIKSADSFLAGEAQTSASRIFEDKVGSPDEFIALDTLGLYRPYLFNVDNNKIVIYSGPPNSKFWVTNTENPFENYMFGGNGRGPGEYLNPIDVELASDGSIFVVDSQLRRLDKWSHSGELIDSKSIDSFAPFRMTLNEHSNELFIFAPSEERLFHRYDRRYNHLSSFQTAPDSLRFLLKNVYLSGEIVSDANGIYYAGNGNHFLKKYTSGGELLFSRVMIEEISPPSLVAESAGNSNGEMLKISDDFKRAARTIESFQNYIFVLYFGNNVNLIGRTVDVYDSDSGDYLYSFNISSKDRRASSIDIDSDGVLYSLEYDKNMNFKVFTYKLSI